MLLGPAIWSQHQRANVKRNYGESMIICVKLRMADHSAIEWTEATWNPVTGCTKISAGCKNCYAERMSYRLQAMGKPQYKNAFALTLQPSALDAPLSWKKPRVIFVNSMSDLFQDGVGLDYTKKVFAVMNNSLRHTYQILTKRPEIAAEYATQLKWSRNN